MKKILPFIVLLLICSACHTFIARDGRKIRQLAPARDRLSKSDLDTNSFVKKPFNLADYMNKAALENNKHIIESVEGSDIQALITAKGRYYLYFWYPVCAGERPAIRKLDSLAGAGANVMIISEYRDYALIDAVLRKTHFAQYPYYVIEADKYTRLLVERKIRFIKDACPACYDQYKDELMFADYVLVDNGTIRAIMDNDNSVLRY